MSFFHNCQIRRKIRIKNIIKSNLSCGRHHFPYCRLLCRKPKALAPCGTNCRSDLSDHDLIRIHNGIHDLNRIISFTKCTGRAMCDALSTKGAIHIFDILHIYRAYTGTFACIDNVPHAHGLDLVADLHTAHTFDTFRRITDDREKNDPMAGSRSRSCMGFQ